MQLLAHTSFTLARGQETYLQAQNLTFNRSKQGKRDILIAVNTIFDVVQFDRSTMPEVL